MSERPNLGALFGNWRRSEKNLLEKIQAVVSNNAKKVRTGQDCCGNHGDPGC